LNFLLLVSMIQSIKIRSYNKNMAHKKHHQKSLFTYIQHDHINNHNKASR